MLMFSKDSFEYGNKLKDSSFSFSIFCFGGKFVCWFSYCFYVLCDVFNHNIVGSRKIGTKNMNKLRRVFKALIFKVLFE